MITLKESLLSKTKNKIEKFDVKELIPEIPTTKDFYKSIYNRHLWELKWHCEGLMNLFRQQYPDLIVTENSYLSFALNTESKEYQDLNIFIIKGNNEHSYWLKGWSHTFSGGNLREYKKDVIKLIERLTNDFNLFEKLFEHMRKCKNSNVFYEEKNLMTDL